MIFLLIKKDSYQSNIHEIDTRKSTALTVFDGTSEEDSKLATQFWNSFALVPPVESTLVCTEIHQRIRTRTANDAKPKCKLIFSNEFISTSILQRDFQQQQQRQRSKKKNQLKVIFN